MKFGDELDQLEEDQELYQDALPCPRCMEEGCEFCDHTGSLVIPPEGAVCPNCEGSGETGHFVFEQECPACSGMGAVDAHRLAELESGNWTEQYSSIAAALENRRTCSADYLNPDFSPFVGEALNPVDFVHQDVSGQDFTGAFLDGAVDPGAVTKHIDYKLVDGELQIANYFNHTFEGTNFSAAQMPGVALGGCNFTRANFHRADLRGALLPASLFEGANLTEAELSGASFKGAILRRAVLRGADLRDADLMGACLTGADLADTNIELASSLEGSQLYGATGLSAEQAEACRNRGATFAPQEHLPPWVSS